MFFWFNLMGENELCAKEFFTDLHQLWSIFVAQLGGHAEPVDLQESGYFASESMSVVHDPASEPLDSQYFANSQGPHDRSREGSLLQTVRYRLYHLLLYYSTLLKHDEGNDLRKVSTL